MSGIAAIVRHDGGPVDERVTSAILSRMERGGPDGTRTFTSGCASVGRAALLTVPEDDLDDQPKHGARGALTAVADARIDNRAELVSELALEPGVSDCAIILAAYERWGDACAARLLGDFSFAIWDAKRRRLFAARDAIGVRALYYANDAAAFRCASEKHALLADPAVAARPDPQSLALFLFEEYLERDRTLYASVRALAPGSTLVVERGEVRETSYYAPDSWRRVRFADPRDYAEAFRATLDAAVRARLRARGPVACQVSGGLDSSSVAILAERAHRGGATTARPLYLHAEYPGLECDEHEYASAVADRWSLPMRVVTPPGAPLTDLELSSVRPDVYYEPIVRVLERMFGAAKDGGARVTLTGLGGDQLLEATGFECVDAIRAGDLRGALRRIGVGRTSLRETGRRFVRHVVRPLVPEAARAAARRMRRRERPWAGERAKLLVAEDRAARRRASRTAAPDRSSAAFCESITHGYSASFLLAHVGALAAGSSSEMRHPFFDRRLVDLVASYPHEERSGGPMRKMLLRRAMHDDLPPLVRDRVNGPFFEPFLHKALIVDDGKLLDALFRSSRLADLDLVRRSELFTLLNRARKDWSLCRDVINVTSLELWIRRCIP